MTLGDLEDKAEDPRGPLSLPTKSSVITNRNASVLASHFRFPYGQIITPPTTRWLTLFATEILHNFGRIAYGKVYSDDVTRLV